MTEAAAAESTNIVRGGLGKKESLPKYARVNTLRCTFADIRRGFAETGHSLQQAPKVGASFESVSLQLRSLCSCGTARKRSGAVQSRTRKSSAPCSYALHCASHLACRSRKSYSIDPHIPNLLGAAQFAAADAESFSAVFPPHSNLGKHPLVANGSLMIQDKASCFASQALNPPPGAFVIDSCAAPGA